MTADSENDIKSLKAIGRICAAVLQKMMQAVRPGVTTGELDKIGQELLSAEGAQSAPELTYQFPGATCISVSPVIAHGIPGAYALHPGELIHIDVSAELDGYFADTGASLWVTKRSPQIHKLLEATRATLARALSVARAGHPLNEIGKTVQREAGKRGYNIIHELTGHGIGHGLHEEPGEILNYYNPRDHRILKEGQVLAIEPFLTIGQGRIKQGVDGWSLRTADNTIAAQFEHTIIVTKNEPIILTAV
jgi:methionyl aminopeptidase